MKQHTRQWLTYLARNKKNSRAVEILDYILALEAEIAQNKANIKNANDEANELSMMVGNLQLTIDAAWDIVNKSDFFNRDEVLMILEQPEPPQDSTQ